MIPRPTLQMLTYNNSPPHPQDVDVWWFPTALQMLMYYDPPPHPPVWWSSTPPSRCWCIMIPHPTPQIDDPPPHYVWWFPAPPPKMLLYVKDVQAVLVLSALATFGDPHFECADASGISALVILVLSVRMILAWVRGWAGFEFGFEPPPASLFKSFNPCVCWFVYSPCSFLVYSLIKPWFGRSSCRFVFKPQGRDTSNRYPAKTWQIPSGSLTMFNLAMENGMQTKK